MGAKNRIAYYAKSNNDDFSEDLIIKIHEKKQFHYLEILNQSIFNESKFCQNNWY